MLNRFTPKLIWYLLLDPQYMFQISPKCMRVMAILQSVRKRRKKRRGFYENETTHHHADIDSFKDKLEVKESLAT